MFAPYHQFGIEPNLGIRTQHNRAQPPTRPLHQYNTKIAIAIADNVFHDRRRHSQPHVKQNHFPPGLTATMYRTTTVPVSESATRYQPLLKKWVYRKKKQLDDSMACPF
jgi:hypothetical protein